MNTKLDRRAEVARNKTKEQFTSLIHLINKEMLIRCHYELSENKATGDDKVTKRAYDSNSDANINDLLTRMKSFKYKPQPVRRVYIEKSGSVKKRPLGIPAYEDKIVQHKFRASIKRVGKWLKENRTLPLTLLMKGLSLKLIGYYRYYGITDNIKKLDRFRYLVRKLTYKWLNRRSQRRSYNWPSFYRMFRYFNVPKAKIYVSIFELKEEVTYIL